MRGMSHVLSTGRVALANEFGQPPSYNFITAAELGHIRRRVCRISTGSKSFDSMLGGGIQTMSITEVFGEFRTGKSQLSMTASVVCQLPKDQGGADGKVAYIDTEGTFRPERIKQISERFGVDGDSACENILYGRALNSEHQLELLNGLCQEFATNEYRLLASLCSPCGGEGRRS